jgi:uncharacterized protein YjbJ (UPF0337 family)
MTARRDRTDKPTEERVKAAATREAKGSVQEAIGKLMGDDAVRERGTAEKEAGAADASGIKKSPRS